jgi:adenine-specific DNA-methyltransferase
MIRSELDVLLERVEDEALRADLRKQIDRLKQRRSFGLVFEQHIPERVRLPQHAILVGSQVVLRDVAASPTYEVVAIEHGLATVDLVRDPDGAYVRHDEHWIGARERLGLDSLVVITDFGEPVLPGFRYLGAVERGGDKPYHVVINGENHHALEALRFTHAGRIDCIYIDPPYNSGARDWKYNNDYVDETDGYRHSKWLAFMERRLQLAKELLNPDDSVLIVTIDEKEYLRLGLLLEQSMANAKIQMVSVAINPAPPSRNGLFGRADEFCFFVLIGAAAVRPAAVGPDWIHGKGRTHRGEIRWDLLRKSGASPTREGHPDTFYPFFVTTDGNRIHSVGDPIGVGADRRSVVPPAGSFAVWPIRQDGSEGRWRLQPLTARQVMAEGGIRLGAGKDERTPIYYLSEGEREKIQSGLYQVTGYREDGSVITSLHNVAARRLVPGTQWRVPAHDATQYGSRLLAKLVLDRKFPYPKSLYAVEDTIRFFVKDKPDALVLDFFAGSGTTAHAVMRLNRQDSGRRQSIMVTNNEVSVDEANGLRAKDLRPGDPEWEALGIFENITRPRVTAAITGRTPDGEPIKGDYKFTDEFPMAEGFEENAAFLELRYADADDVDLGLAYDDIAPLLWLRAGAQGPIASRTDDAGNPVPYAWTGRYGVLFDEDRWRSFVSACPDTATTAFIVTHSPTAFAGIAAELPTNMDTVRLPDTYLSMFLPERGRA